MATFTQEGAALSDDDILKAFMDEAFPEDAEEATPKDKASPTDSKEEEPEAPTEADDEEHEGDTEDTESEDKETKQDDEAWVPSSLQELAEAMEVDVDALKAIKVKTKVDGVEADVPLGEVIKNYQLNKSITDRSEQLAHAKKHFAQVATEFENQRNIQLSQWQVWNNVLESRLRDQVASVDWQQLREEDPAEYAAKRQEFTERIGEIEHLKSQVAQQTQQQRMQMMHSQQTAYANALQQNIAKLPELIPEFKDAAKMKEEMQEMRNYLINVFSPEEVDSIVDARHVLIARKAMLYDKLTEGGKPKVEKMKEKPKFVKPTARKSAAQAGRTEQAKHFKRARDSQSIDDWAKVLEDFV